MNGSGFFLFNEDDIKNMTEMSPKNKSGRINFRTNILECDLVDLQNSSRQKPIIKVLPQFQQSYANAMRIRSISYQNQ